MLYFLDLVFFVYERGPKNNLNRNAVHCVVVAPDYAARELLKDLS